MPLSLEINASLLYSFSFSYISFAFSWNIFSFSLMSFAAWFDSVSLFSSLLAISVQALSFWSSFSAAARIALSLALVASVILYFSPSFISFACYWIIICFSLSLFIARVDSASDSFSLFSISACKLFCSVPPQCSSYIHKHNSKRIGLTLSSSSSFSFSSSFLVVFVIFTPRADRGVIYMRVIEKFGRFDGFVATGLGRSEYVRRRWFRQLWGED